MAHIHGTEWENFSEAQLNIIKGTFLRPLNENVSVNNQETRIY